MAKKIERDGVTYIAERERFYCSSWHLFTNSNYMCWKWGWTLKRESDGVVIFSGFDPLKRSCMGVTKPDFKVFKELKEAVDEMPLRSWEKEIGFAERMHARKLEEAKR